MHHNISRTSSVLGIELLKVSHRRLFPLSSSAWVGDFTWYGNVEQS